MSKFFLFWDALFGMQFGGKFSVFWGWLAGWFATSSEPVPNTATAVNKDMNKVSIGYKNI